jgi:hypothetical protein
LTPADASGGADDKQRYSIDGRCASSIFAGARAITCIDLERHAEVSSLIDQCLC